MRFFLFFFFLTGTSVLFAQTKSVSSAQVLHQLMKLKVHGSVLYIAAHPDDENTRLLSYLANERKVRTGYLSLTRGDGGQNLIGDEQGVDLGLIRTQELLAARRIDGAEQFFSSAYDFGYSKQPDETLEKWNHDKILSEVVFVIRQFKPDIIITRFPTTGEGGHGHHTASAIIAEEAFDAAADPSRFREFGLLPWKTKRLFWNTFNFGSVNTQKEDQLKIDVGGFNPLLGISYGEMAAESRSKHKSQGFGVPAQRGLNYEYFSLIKGDAYENDLFDGIDVGSGRYSFESADQQREYESITDELISGYSMNYPENSIDKLQELYDFIVALGSSHPLYERLAAVRSAMLDASGLFLEALSVNAFNTLGDSASFIVTVNNRTGLNIDSLSVKIFDKKYDFKSLPKNENRSLNITSFISADMPASQPYWLQQPLGNGSFSVSERDRIGQPENYTTVKFILTINNRNYEIEKPLYFKSTDPVKGEQYRYAVFIQPMQISAAPSVVLLTDNKPIADIKVNFCSYSNSITSGKPQWITSGIQFVADTLLLFKKNNVPYTFQLKSADFKPNTVSNIEFRIKTPGKLYNSGLKKIEYDHIPALSYSNIPTVRVLRTNLNTDGKTVGYIAGAGDKVPEALQQMGYKVIMLQEADVVFNNIRQFDVIVTGVRAYNIHTWLSNAYSVLMRYVEEGGTLLVQYNTNNSIGPLKADISPYPFTITRNRVTDENAKVNFLLPAHPLLNYPNKITGEDFNGWVQERCIYSADNIDNRFQKILSMSDPNETAQEGSLLVADIGKGRFIYTGIAFFRQLPQGVPGAYRLFANLIAKRKL